MEVKSAPASSFLECLSFQAVSQGTELMFKRGGQSRTGGPRKCLAAAIESAPKWEELFSVSYAIRGHNSSWELMSAMCLLILYSPEICLLHRQCFPHHLVKWKSYGTAHSSVKRLSGRREGCISLLFKMQKAFQKAVWSNAKQKFKRDRWVIESVTAVFDHCKPWLCVFGSMGLTLLDIKGRAWNF